VTVTARSARGNPAYFPIFTSVTALTRLLASTNPPSRVTEALRTMSPPPGMDQLWNVSVLGSKRTTVFGLVPVSLYQTTSLIAEMPYGCDLARLGERYSVTFPWSGPAAPDNRAGSVYSLISSVAGIHGGHLVRAEDHVEDRALRAHGHAVRA
jgi:hypothetical protein